MKKLLLITLALATTALLFGCGGNSGTSGTGDGKFTLTNDVCKDFSADFVYSAIGKPIVRVEPSTIAGIMRCEYYTTYQTDYYKLPNGTAQPGGSYVAIQLENTLSVENQKKGLVYLGRTLSEDPRIKMDHFIATQEDGQIYSIFLILGPMKFVNVERGDTQVITNEENILFAVKVAEMLNGKLNFKIQKNPVDTTTAEEKATAAEPSHEQVVKDFFTYLANKNIDQALAMMDANAETKQGRNTNFATIQSLKVTQIAPIYQEERTSERQVYKVDLNVSVTSQGEQFGWNQGKNTRRVSVQKVNSTRIIHELANNP